MFKRGQRRVPGPKGLILQRGRIERKNIKEARIGQRNREGKTLMRIVKKTIEASPTSSKRNGGWRKEKRKEGSKISKKSTS